MYANYYELVRTYALYLNLTLNDRFCDNVFHNRKMIMVAFGVLFNLGNCKYGFVLV